MSQPIQTTFAKIIAQFTVVLVLITGLLALTTEVKAETQQLVSEQRIAGQVRSSIAFERAFDDQHISVHVTEQIITLYGAVDSPKTLQSLVFFMQDFTTDYQVDIQVAVRKQPQQQTKPSLLRLISF
ncbi:BON domain-containing protein [Alteromonas sp. ASW11-36]|uniref:BON domain-containing protein n=1 Tax=Alteromonas arenosi TaxID=3055817 RepID=A0ABT7SWB9_9ALTE|nr:BON domain-containing protein [Alteromonas sp. ASW11-36]MDM7860469.1 BON domain-containing protein [Alteromonas sp. ASW11-36]